MNKLDEVFSNYFYYLKSEQSVKDTIYEEVKNLERFIWQLHAQFEKVHTDVQEKVIRATCLNLLEDLKSAPNYFVLLSKVIPDGQFYKYNNAIRTPTQKLIEVIALVHYLLYDKLVTMDEVALLLGLKALDVTVNEVVNQNNTEQLNTDGITKSTTSQASSVAGNDVSKDTTSTSPDSLQVKADCSIKETDDKGSVGKSEGVLEEGDNNRILYLDLEDYLIGCLLMSSALARLAVNAVSACNYDLPVRINKFLRELHSAYTLLHFKNSFLRKTYDELKYSLKKTEDIIYNLSLRGLVKPIPKDDKNLKRETDEQVLLLTED